jgi:hypothetical protein
MESILSTLRSHGEIKVLEMPWNSFGQVKEESKYYILKELNRIRYAVRESTSKIKVFKNFKEIKTFRPNFSAEGLFGGTLIGVKGKDFVCLYDWEECRVVR